MAKIGKITIYVETQQNAQIVRVRTVGKRGPTALNTISTDQGYLSQSPFDTAHNFWTDVLTKALTQLT